MFYRLIISSPLGDLIAVADESHLLMLEFADSKGLEKKASFIAKNGPFSEAEFLRRVKAIHVSEAFRSLDRHTLFHFIRDDKTNTILTQTQLELSEYFEGKRKSFNIPLSPSGTEFQKQAWKALTRIPYGETRSYKEEAILAGNPKAVRAIGGANNKNPIAIIIPCHRVIGADGSLVGYAGGIDKKIWLLDHEQAYYHLP